ncbi:MAG: hypothetical protein JO091_14675 [Acidobacteriaceae bacterium]|nr:hypothetical protein [Acidobacteriaceae bacterium]
MKKKTRRTPPARQNPASGKGVPRPLAADLILILTNAERLPYEQQLGYFLAALRDRTLKYLNTVKDNSIKALLLGVFEKRREACKGPLQLDHQQCFKYLESLLALEELYRKMR